MSENLDRSERDFSRFDSMSTEQLQEILRQDAHRPEGTESDIDEILYIMEVLSERRRNDSTYTGKTVQEAYETFQKHYMPRDDEENIETQSTVIAPKPTARWLRPVCAVAAVLAIVILATVSVDAFGFDLWGKVASWSQEFFHFADEPQGTDSSEPDKQDGIEYASLQDALDEFEISQKLAPMWLPEGYELAEIEIADSPMEISILARYENGDAHIRISIRQLIGGIPEQVEKNDGFIESYVSDGITYYIFSNYENLRAVWVVDEFECYISGKITVDEMKEIIDSI